MMGPLARARCARSRGSNPRLYEPTRRNPSRDQSSAAPFAIQVRTRSISSELSGAVGGMRDPHGGMSVSFRYSRLMSGLPGTTNDKPPLVHSELLAGLLSSELRTALAVAPAGM